MDKRFSEENQSSLTEQVRFNSFLSDISLMSMRLCSRAHRIFDLLAVSRPSSSVSLSKQPIMILAHNGVPFQCFSTLQEQGLKDLITPLMQWHGENATAQLWDAINQVGNVTRCRLQRLAAGASRALGFEKRRFDATDPREDEDLDADFEELAQSSRNALNGGGPCSPFTRSPG
jgi:hypothetical protein